MTRPDLTLDATTPRHAYTTPRKPLGGNVSAVASNQRRHGSMLSQGPGEEMLPAWVSDWISYEGAPTGVRLKLAGVKQRNGRIRYAIYNQHASGQHKLILGYAYLDSELDYIRLAERLRAEAASQGISVGLAAMAPVEDDQRGLLDDFWEGVERRGEGAVDQLLDRDDFDRRKRLGLGPSKIITYGQGVKPHARRTDD